MGRWATGVLAAIGGAVKYLVLPLALIFGLAAVAGSIGGESAENILNTDEMVLPIIVLGVAVTTLCFFRGFFPRGSLSRMSFGVGSMAVAGIWVWVLTRGGQLTVDIGEMGMTLDFLGFVILFLAVVALQGAVLRGGDVLLPARSGWPPSREISWPRYYSLPKGARKGKYTLAEVGGTKGSTHHGN